MARSNSRDYVATIDWLERMPSSANGNPRYRIHFTDGTSAPTEVDGSVAYGLEGREYRTGPVTVSAYVKSGNVWNVVPDADDGSLTIGDRSRDGLLEIADTRWDSNGTLFVTVRELIGGGAKSWPGGKLPIAAMRRLARRAMPHPEKTRSSRLVRTFEDSSCGFATFAVSRLDPS